MIRPAVFPSRPTRCRKGFPFAATEGGAKRPFRAPQRGRPLPGRVLGRLDATAGPGWAAGGPVVVILSPAGFLLHLRVAPATPGGV